MKIWSLSPNMMIVRVIYEQSELSESYYFYNEPNFAIEFCLFARESILCFEQNFRNSIPIKHAYSLNLASNLNSASPASDNKLHKERSQTDDTTFLRDKIVIFTLKPKRFSENHNYRNQRKTQSLARLNKKKGRKRQGAFSFVDVNREEGKGRWKEEEEEEKIETRNVGIIFPRCRYARALSHGYVLTRPPPTLIRNQTLPEKLRLSRLLIASTVLKKLCNNHSTTNNGEIRPVQSHLPEA